VECKIQKAKKSLSYRLRLISTCVTGVVSAEKYTIIQINVVTILKGTHETNTTTFNKILIWLIKKCNAVFDPKLFFQMI
jgi:hypothetical protein